MASKRRNMFHKNKTQETTEEEERNKLLKEVEDEWRERERRESTTATSVDDSMTDGSEEDDRDDRDECVTKGKSMPLSAFFRIARNTMAMWFKPDATPSAADVEAEFWRHVSTGQSHVCVHSASIESATWGYGFPTTKSSSTSRHPWNLKVLTNNPGSILRSIGPLMGVTVPTLHVGMLFSTCCWYRDPHALPWIEYLHTGATKVCSKTKEFTFMIIVFKEEFCPPVGEDDVSTERVQHKCFVALSVYGVPDEWSDELRGALKGLLPRYVRDKAVWLASDIAMVPPALLVERGVALCRTVQEPGQFVLVFPKAFTSSICTGYVVSESVYFARPMWLDTAEKVFKDIQESCEPTVFSLEKLLFCIANDSRSSVDVLNQVLPMVVNIRETEVRMRRELEEVGLVATERLPGVTKGRQSSKQNNQHDYDCDTCRGTLFLSLVTNSHEEVNYCLTHAVEMLKKDPSQLKHCKLLYGYDEEEMEELIEKVKSRIEMKSQKKGGQGGGAGRSSGGASAANTTKNN
ncbi:hypothetical protein AAG570_011886 [Ranatra chinensis]|uniref:JmjC domain-containing protein n=1 Tax=Ranatra chinensis TaxID=642074 RepID=A0ABD0YHM3_9HEMI